MKSIQFPITIFYDASCPLCRSEMEALKTHDKDARIILEDCSATAFEAPLSCPVTKEAMLDRIHAIDAAGQWLHSTEVFAVAYGAVGFNKVARFWGSRLLQPVFKVVYPWVADNRYWLSKTPLPKLFQWLIKLKSQQ